MRKSLMLLCLLLTSCAITRKADDILVCFGVCAQVRAPQVTVESIEEIPCSPPRT